jgi:hypothetical protein
MYKILIQYQSHNHTEIVFRAVAANGQKTYSDIIRHHWDEHALTRFGIFSRFTEEARRALLIPECEKIEFKYE